MKMTWPLGKQVTFNRYLSFFEGLFLNMFSHHFINILI